MPARDSVAHGDPIARAVKSVCAQVSSLSRQDIAKAGHVGSAEVQVNGCSLDNIPKGALGLLISLFDAADQISAAPWLNKIKEMAVGRPVCEHPQGVKPWGSYWWTGGDNRRPTGVRLNDLAVDHCLPKKLFITAACLPWYAFVAGLGTLRLLPDELVMGILSHLAAGDLCRASASSHFLYCFCSHDELWRALTLQVPL